MTSRSPPRLATWLLEALCTNSHVDALLGDLEEQFGKGRSRVWYWRQATGALTLNFLQTLRAHGLSFATAVLAGWALTSLWVLANALAFRSLYDSLDAARHPWSWDTFERFMGLHAAQGSLTVLVFVSGWIVTRIHRAHRRAVLMAFVLVLVAQRLPALARLATDGIVDGRLPPPLIPEIVRTSIQAVFTLVAGLWVIRKDRFADMHPRTHFAVLVMFVMIAVSSALYDAWIVGALKYPAAVRYPIDALEIASGAYFAFLLWHSNSTSAQTPPPIQLHRTGVSP